MSPDSETPGTSSARTRDTALLCATECPNKQTTRASAGARHGRGPRGRHGRAGRDCNLNGVTPETGEAPVTVVAMDVSAEPAEVVDEQLVRQLVDQARAEGLKLTGEGGLLGR